MPTSVQQQGSAEEKVVEIDRGRSRSLSAVLEQCKKGDAQGALSQALELVDADNLDALYVVGAIYEIGGNGVPKDPSKAAFYYERAMSEAGSIGAWLGMARLHFLGKGVERNFEEAFRCYSVVAEDADDPMAWLMLGRMYFEGKGVKKDDLRAREALHKAAASGYVFAFTYLGHLEREQGRWWKARLLYLRAFWLSLVLDGKDKRAQLG